MAQQDPFVGTAGLLVRAGRKVRAYLCMIPRPPKIERQEHYGADVWTHVEMDDLRKTQCLCRRCERCKPGSKDHCGTADAIFKICIDRDVAMAITRCPHFSSLPHGQLGDWTRKV